MPRDLFEEAGLLPEAQAAQPQAQQPRDLFAEAGIAPEEQTVAPPDNRSFSQKILGGAQELGEGMYHGIGNMGAGWMQRVAETGGDFAGSVYRNALSAYRPDLADEFKNLTSDDVRRAAGNVSAESNKRSSESGLYAVGKITGEIAPLLGVNVGGPIASGLAAGALSGVLTPTQAETRDESINQMIRNTAVGTGLGGAAGLAAKGVGSLINKFKNSPGVNPETVQTFTDAGLDPTLGATTGSAAVKTAQTALSRFPGSSGIIERSVQRTKDQVQQQLSQFGLDKAVTPQRAGEVIQEGLERGVERGKEHAAKVYNIFEQHVAPTDSFAIPNSTKFLDDIGGRSTNPAVLEDLQKKGGYKIIKEMADSATDGTLNYRDIKYFRTKIGDMLGDKFTIGGQERPLLKEAYSALTADMRDAAIAKGPKALRAFDRSNELYSKFIDNFETNLSGVLNKNAPEQMYKAVKDGTKLGGTKADAIMSKLNREQREIVRGSVFRDLGGGVDNFDAIKAVHEINKLSPEAKTALFKGAENLSEPFNKLSNAVRILQNNKQFTNPSGSGHVGIMGLFLGASTLSPTAAVSSLAGANISARLLTSPKFVNWLADGMTLRSQKAAAGHFSKLQAISRSAPELREDIMKYLDSAGQQPDTSADDAVNVPALKTVGPQSSNQSPINQTISDVAQFAGVEPDLLHRIVQRESNYNPNAKNPKSSASGLFQFTDSTWDGLVDRYGKQFGVTREHKNDPAANALMGGLYTRMNRQSLADQLNREPTNSELYAAHFLGPSGAYKLITYPKRNELAARIFPKAAKANRSIFFDGKRARTLDEVTQQLDV